MMRLLSIGLLTTTFRRYTLNILHSVEEIAKKKGISMAQVALAWVMAQDPVAAPIVGTTKLENLHDIISEPSILYRRSHSQMATESVDVKLDEDEIKYLGEKYVSRSILGH